MGRAQPPIPTMQELIRRRTRQGFVGRGSERAAFRANFDLPIEDERRRFLFHVRGNAGIGKTFLARELEQIAQERGALTAYLDDGVGSVPEAMAVIADRFARQGHRCKDLERLLAAHRERRYEAELAAVAFAEPDADTDAAGEAGPGAPAGAGRRSGDTGAAEPSAASLAAARATLVALGLVPVVGPFAGAVDPGELVRQAARLRAGLGARARGHEDAELLLAPELVLTPALLEELGAVASEVPWLVLFFDTYERTGAFLDPWLHDLVSGDRYGPLPGNVVLVTAGRHPLDAARWGGLTDFVLDLPLRPFTETESRGLLAAKGVLAEPVVDEVLRLTGGLPVLVSTLAEARPADLDDLADTGDASAVAVERFLKWETDPLRRAAALTCALPRWLDTDVFRVTVAGAATETDGRAGPGGGAGPGGRAGSGGGGRPDRGPRPDDGGRPDGGRATGTAGNGGRVAGADAGDRHAPGAGAADHVDAGHVDAGHDHGSDALFTWLRALPFVTDRGDRVVFHDVVRAPMVRLQRLRSPRLWSERHRRLADAFAGWRAEIEAGEETEVETAGQTEGGTRGETEAGPPDSGSRDGRSPDSRSREREWWGGERWRELRLAEAYHRLCAGERGALAGVLRAVVDACGEGEAVARRWAEALTQAGQDAADEDAERWGRELLGALERGGVHDALGALLLRAGLDARREARARTLRGRALHREGAHERAVTEYDRALALDPDSATAWQGRAVARAHTGDYAGAVADLDRADALAPDDVTTLVLRGDYHRLLGDLDAAVADLDRAVALDPVRRSTWASRGAARHAQGRLDEALADLDRALELDGAYVWALMRRARVRRSRGEYERQLADLHHAVALDPDASLPRCERADALRGVDRDEEALADYDRAIALNPLYASAYAGRGVSRAKLGRHDAALTDLDTALALFPDYPWALRHRAALHLELGDAERASADAGRARELRPGDPSIEDLHTRAARAAATTARTTPGRPSQ
ncbi:tetratricopeptide repeat protein [Streptomyces caniscabiei]|uniref:tetratricopeptide repeat protein n=1 Tax=Streptomyces caniscabiei TaxID=2746961 RepID=UPI001CE2067C|nr:tetratricopeptide repeat protein [Streptomyces caniscabiei]MDX3510339.1 tetratricopeptide repeat protein [Streptomyces caniscabiei]MDX3720423.1 tetratricopeptide repeat protein [Streptomyces caniscabiei]WEO26276.1 tetratricopeptide repeat protein [Streptomyces caniscabiei]